MNNKLMIGIIVILLLSFGFFLIKNESPTGEIIKEGSGEVQKITLGMKNYNYYPQTVKVKVNQPVQIYLDKSVGGCYRSFTIREFKIGKYLATPQDYVEFTPTKTGSFKFSCSMGMGVGTLIVE